MKIQNPGTAQNLYSTVPRSNDSNNGAATRNPSHPSVDAGGWDRANATAFASGLRSADDPDARLKTRLRNQFQHRFTNLASNKQQFHSLFAKVYGRHDSAAAESIRKKTLAGDTSWMPQIQLVDRESLGGANGAYSAKKGTVYLSRDLTSNPSLMSKTLNEEVGHHIDTKVRGTDTPGDEGEMFRRLLDGETLSKAQVQAIRTENDKGAVNINGERTEVEFFFKKIKKAFKKVTGGVGRVFKKVTSGIANGVKKVGSFVGNAVKGAGRLVGGVFQKVGNVARNIVGKVGDIVGKVGNVARNVVGKVGDIIGKVGNVARNIVGKVGDIVGKGVRGVVGLARKGLGAAFRIGKSVFRGVTGLVGKAFQTVRGIASKIFQGVTGLAGKAFGIFGGLAKSVFGGVTGVLGRIFSPISSILNTVMNGVFGLIR